MIVQDVAWLIWFIGTALIALVFLWVVVQAGKPASEAEQRESARRSRSWQGWTLGVLLAAFAVGSWATLCNFPIPEQHGALGATQVVDVVGHMWYWELSTNTVKAGSDVEFRVTSADVNHGFAIYSPQGRIVTQTQAMPGYTNRLVHNFSEPGTYTVQCLEYCGIGHDPMKTTIEVVPAQGD